MDKSTRAFVEYTREAVEEGVYDDVGSFGRGIVVENVLEMYDDVDANAIRELGHSLDEAIKNAITEWCGEQV